MKRYSLIGLKLNGLLLIFFFLQFLSPSLFGGDVLHRGGVLELKGGTLQYSGRNYQQAFYKSPKLLFELGKQRMEEKLWRSALEKFKILIKRFPNSQEAKGAYYAAGVSAYYATDYGVSNHYLSKYLERYHVADHLHDVMELKFNIAEKLINGENLRSEGFLRAQKWLSGDDLAERLYDEVILVLPDSELAAQSYLARAKIDKSEKQYEESIRSYELFIKHFPKHEQVADVYVEIVKLYYLWAKVEPQNPDLLQLVSMHCEKFAQVFPGEARLNECLEEIEKMKEVFADNFYETGKFYERVKKREAAVIYYEYVIQQFPNTKVAKTCKERLTQIR